ncbi:MAG: winged helix-turn-helix domain-containing protein [candidate division WOR-3 bacterium]|nr:MAG: winged helix-turn-helix domain-containing protein [candidate division WOR-3 bacterium]
MKKRKKMKKKRRMKKAKKAKKKKKKPSIRELTIDILKRSKTPLHYRDITKRLKKRGYRFHRKDPERSVYIIINRYPKIFKRVKPATYRLK